MNSIDVTIGDDLFSHATGNNFHYVNANTLDFKPIHEFLHNLGLADRYHHVQRVDQHGATSQYSTSIVT